MGSKAGWDQSSPHCYLSLSLSLSLSHSLILSLSSARFTVYMGTAATVEDITPTLPRLPLQSLGQPDSPEPHNPEQKLEGLGFRV